MFFPAPSSSSQFLTLASLLPKFLGPPTTHQQEFSGQLALYYKDPGTPAKLSRGGKAWISKKQSTSNHLDSRSFSTLHATSKNIVFATADRVPSKKLFPKHFTRTGCFRRKNCFILLIYFINPLKLKVWKKLKEGGETQN